jgi:hypothetical protein
MANKSRTERKATEALMRKQHRKAASGSGDPNAFALREEVNRAVQQLARAQDQLVATVNQNLHGIGVAFSMSDAHFMVQRRILNDMHKDDVQLGDQGEIDWNWYHLQYNGMIGFCSFFADLKRLLELESAQAKSSTTAQMEEPSSSDDYEFGSEQGQTSPTII